LATLAQEKPRHSGARFIEEYEVDADAYASDPKTSKQILRYFNVCDRLGHVVLRYEIQRGDVVWWRRHEFVYDRRGNITADLEYESVKLPKGQDFTIDHSGREPRMVPEVEERATDITLNKYNDHNDLIEPRQIDEHQNLMQMVEWGFDDKGRRVSFKNTLNGRVVAESRILYSPDGRISTETEQIEGKHTETLSAFDDKGRSTRQETFILQPTPSELGATTRVLSTRWTYVYSGDTTTTESLTCDDNGEPKQRMLFVDRGDYAISAKTFQPKLDGGKLSWVLNDDFRRDYFFDSYGEVIRYVGRRRSSDDQPFKINEVEKMVITY